MPDVDTSIYQTLKPVQQAPQNPLSQFATFANTQNALNQNAQFQQMFQARQAIGPIYQQSIDPKTGELDTNKLMSLASQDPRTAWMAGDIAQQAMSRRQTQIGIDTAQFDLMSKHLNRMNQSLTSLLNNQNLSRNDVVSSVGDLVAEGLLTPQMAATELSSMPEGGPQLRNWVTMHMVRNLDTASQLKALYGDVSTVNTGGQTKIIAASPVTGAREIGSLTNTMDPGTASSPTPAMIRNPDGTLTPSNVTRQQFADMSKSGGVATAPALTAEGLNPAEASQPTEWYDPTTRQKVTGTRSEFLRAQQADNAEAVGDQASPMVPTADNQGARAKPRAGGGPLPAGPALGAEAAANVTGTEAAKQGIALQTAADAVPNTKALLGNLEADLENFASGPGADWSKVAKAWVNRQSPLGDVFDPKKIASQEEFGKQSFQLAQQQFQALGGTGTDSKLESTMHTSPSDFLSNLGNKGIIALLKGNADAISAKNDAWQAWQTGGPGQPGHGPETYGQFSTQFNKTFDPRIFQAQYLSPEDRQNMLKGMTENEKKAFASNLRIAVDNGWVKLPGASGGGQ